MTRKSYVKYYITAMRAAERPGLDDGPDLDELIRQAVFIYDRVEEKVSDRPLGRPER